MGRKDAIHPVDPTRQLPGDEVADVLRRVAAGALSVELTEAGRVWRADDPGDYAVRADGYEMVLFNDNGSLDYVAKAVAPDGRKGSFDFWFDRGQEPVNLITVDECAAVEHALAGRKIPRG